MVNPAYRALLMYEVYRQKPSVSELAGMKAEFARLFVCKSEREKLLCDRYRKAIREINRTVLEVK